MQREVTTEFRTPQQPSTGTNDWGGASPLLAQSIPTESLEQRYLRLNSTQTRDEIFPTQDDNFLILGGESAVPEPIQEDRDDTAVAPPAPASRRGLLSRLMMGRWREKKAAAQLETADSVTLGLKKKKWFCRLDPQNRWPQGWCWGNAMALEFSTAIRL